MKFRSTLLKYYNRDCEKEYSQEALEPAIIWHSDVRPKMHCCRDCDIYRWRDDSKIEYKKFEIYLQIYARYLINNYVIPSSFADSKTWIKNCVNSTAMALDNQLIWSCCATKKWPLVQMFLVIPLRYKLRYNFVYHIPSFIASINHIDRLWITMWKTIS